MMLTHSATPDEISQIDAQIRSGKTITDTYRARLTSSKRLGRHFDAHPEWAAEIRKLSEANSSRKKSLNSAHRNDKHCKRGHLLPEKPNCMSRGRPYRRCVKCAREADRRGGAPAPELVQKVEAKLIAGATPASIIRVERLMKFYSFKKVCRENATIAELARRARVISRPAIITPRRPALTGIIAARPDAIFSAINAAVSWRLPKHIRDEVVMLTVLDVLEHRIALSDIDGAIKKHKRALYNEVDYGPRSLDAPAWRDSSVPLVETIAHSVWM